MTPRDIIARSWALTLQHPALRGWSFVASFLETCIDTWLIVFQTTFLVTYLRTGHVTGFFDVGSQLYFFLPTWVFWGGITGVILLFINELFVPHLCRGAVIGLGAKAHLGEPTKGGLVLALYNFFPLFTLHGFVFLSSWTTTVSLISLILRYFEDPVRSISIAMLLFFFLLMNGLKFMFAFADQAVVVRKMSIFAAIARSIKIIVSHLSSILFLVVLLLVISIRIILNAAVVIILPALITGLGLLLALVFSPAASTVISAIVGLIALLVISYFFSYLYAFKVTVWTVMFLELDKEKDLDVIQ